MSMSSPRRLDSRLLLARLAAAASPPPQRVTARIPRSRRRRVFAARPVPGMSPRATRTTARAPPPSPNHPVAQPPRTLPGSVREIRDTHHRAERPGGESRVRPGPDAQRTERRESSRPRRWRVAVAAAAAGRSLEEAGAQGPTRGWEPPGARRPRRRRATRWTRPPRGTRELNVGYAPRRSRRAPPRAEARTRVHLHVVRDRAARRWRSSSPRRSPRVRRVGPAPPPGVATFAGASRRGRREEAPRRFWTSSASSPRPRVRRRARADPRPRGDAGGEMDAPNPDVSHHPAASPRPPRPRWRPVPARRRRDRGMASRRGARDRALVRIGTAPSSARRQCLNRR